MFGSLSSLQQTSTIAPVSFSSRASKRLRSCEHFEEALSSQNTSRWFSRSRLCSELLLNRAEVERALFCTPAFREELTVRNSCVWPTTFDSKHVGIFGSAQLRNTMGGIARGAVISRSFKTKAASSSGTFHGADPSERADARRQVGGRPREKESHTDRYIRIFQDRDVSDAEEHRRLRIAFAEGYRSKPLLESLGFYRWLLRLKLAAAIVFLYFVTRNMSLPFGKPAEILPKDVDITFEDVVGVDEAKQELREIVEFLRNPEKFSHLGGRLPKGALLVGPPGTGKTLLARAVAGEAKVPFFHASGSEFDEMFVGRGAKKIRSLFQVAKKRAPCVVFIDEIDAVGKKRSSSALHPHANQTINQLLTEMDGFRQNGGVIVLGATNRRDDLDQALLRPGRFDTEIQVPLPDIRGRTNLLEYYLSRVKVDQDVDLEYLARGTIGFTGADIENMVNQAALKAAVDGKASVTRAYLENARDKILMGPEQNSRIPDHEDNLITAYHEGGHALVSYYSKDAMPIHKVTIIARGSALGHTAHIPSKDGTHLTKSQILARMDTLLGGRASEELMLGAEKVTTGGSSDLQQATNLATNMVKHWGMSEKVGERSFKAERDSDAVVNELSEPLSELIDQEIKRALHESMERAKHILRTHERELKLLVDALLKYETLDAKEVKQLLETGSLDR